MVANSTTKAYSRPSWTAAADYISHGIQQNEPPGSTTGTKFGTTHADTLRGVILPARERFDVRLVRDGVEAAVLQRKHLL